MEQKIDTAPAVVPEDAIPVSKQIVTLQQHILYAAAQAQRTKRWGRFKLDERYRVQNVLQHLFEQVRLTEVALFIEAQFGSGEPLNMASLIIAAGIHDLGEEGEPNHNGEGHFDVPWTEKLGDKKAYYDELERKRFRHWLSQLPLEEPYKSAVVSAYQTLYEIQYENTREGRFFNALERIGYVMHMFEELEAGHQKYASDLPLHHDELDCYAEEFISIKVLYAPYRPKMLALLKGKNGG